MTEQVAIWTLVVMSLTGIGGMVMSLLHLASRFGRMEERIKAIGESLGTADKPGDVVRWSDLARRGIQIAASITQGSTQP